MQCIPAQQRQNILDMYRQGMPMSALSRSTGFSYQLVRKVLLEHHVQIRPRGASARRGSCHPSSKLTDSQRELLCEELRRGVVQHNQLARCYGISRERVRQLAKDISAPTGRDIRRRIVEEKTKLKKELRFQRSMERKQSHIRHYGMWCEMWKAGKSLKEMAGALGVSPAGVGVRITELRKRHPDWFPYRRRVGAA